jgi:hypothetical protein
MLRLYRFAGLDLLSPTAKSCRRNQGWWGVNFAQAYFAILALSLCCCCLSQQQRCQMIDLLIFRGWFFRHGQLFSSCMYASLWHFFCGGRIEWPRRCIGVGKNSGLSARCVVAFIRLAQLYYHPVFTVMLVENFNHLVFTIMLTAIPFKVYQGNS